MGTSAFPVIVSAVVVCCLCFRLAVGARILLVPVNINSHVGYFGRLSEQLAELGHDTHLLVTSNVRVEPELLELAASAPGVLSNSDVATNRSQSTPNVSSSKPGRFTIERYAVDGNVSFSNSPEMSRLLVEIALAESLFERFRIAGPFFDKLSSSVLADCIRLMDNVELLSRLRAEEFEMVIMDLAFMPCYVLPYALEIPYHATLSASIHGLAYRVPRLPSFVSDVGHSDRMSFTERLSSFAQTVMLTYAMAPSVPADISKRYAPSRPHIDVYQLIFNRASLWLYLEHPAVSFPRPLMPNTVPVGDLMTGKPLKPLPVEVENFLSSAESTHAHVVVISFGSILDKIPDVVQRKLCDAVARLMASDADNRPIWIIWKLKNVDTACRGSTLPNERHLLAIPWLPQYDLLADRRVDVFVTHGGFNSIVEAVYHSKPMVVIPVSLDQPSNAAVVESKGLGIRLELVDPALADSLPAAVRRVLGDADFAKRAGHASAVLRDLYGSETAAERASRAIEHVIKYGDQHLKTGAFDLSVWQFLMFDICVFLLTAIILLFATGTLWVVVLLRCCRRKYCSVQGKEKLH